MAHAPLVALIDKVVACVGETSRRETLARVEAVFAAIKQHTALSRDELKRFMDMMTLVLLVVPRGMTVRMSGRRQASCPREERLEFDDNYEVALNRTLDFLARNFLHHVEKYEPRGYVRAALRMLAKEYAASRERHAVDVQVDTLLEYLPEDDTAPVAAASPARGGSPYDYIRELEPGGRVFYDWFVGNLSRRELAELYELPVSDVEAALLEVARDSFEDGRFYPIVSSLVRLGTDGDIYWLSLKGLTAKQIGEKVEMTNWSVYKHLESLRQRFGRLRHMGRRGKVFGDWLCGQPVGPEGRRTVISVLREYGEKLGLVLTDFLESPAAV